MRSNDIVVATAVALAALSASGCGKSSDAAAQTNGSQPVAKPGGTGRALPGETLGETDDGGRVGKQPQGPTVTPGTGPSLTLRFRIAKGRKTRYAIAETTSGEAPGRQAGSFTMKQSGLATVEITDQTAGGFAARITLSHMSMDMGAARRGPAKTSNPLASMNGQSYESSYDSLGNLQGSGTTDKHSIANMVVGMVGATDKGFMGIVLPSQAVQVGSTWRSKVDPGKILGILAGSNENSSGEIDMTYTLQKIGSLGAEKIAVIGLAMAGKLVVSVSAKEARSRAPTSVAVVVDGRGTLTLDASTGEVVDQSLVANVGMDLAGTKISMRQAQSVKREK